MHSTWGWALPVRVVDVVGDGAGGTPAVSATVGIRGDDAVVTIVGPLDLWTLGVLLSALAQALSLAGTGVVVDLSACSFVSGRAFSAIEDAAAFLEARGQRLEVWDPPASFRIIRSWAEGSAPLPSR